MSSSENNLLTGDMISESLASSDPSLISIPNASAINFKNLFQRVVSIPVSASGSVKAFKSSISLLSLYIKCVIISSAACSSLL